MCGICGIYNYKTKKSVYVNQLNNMNDCLSHRGPDDAGIYANNNIGLGHRRLSIIDLKTGGQPIFNEDNTICIVYNGEFYNYKEYISLLINKGHVLKTTSDTEVILHLYEEYGEKCLNFINGMFAFAIWDSRRKSLFVARDRLGVKPLYYSFDNDGILFSSEIKPILKMRKEKTKLNYEALFDYMHFQYSLDDMSFFNDIKKLMPGHYFTVKDTFELKEYWDCSYDYSHIDYDHSEEYFKTKIKELLYDAVKIRLNSDVEVGTFLSGGLDSSTITSIAAELSNCKIKTFSGGYKFDGLKDETYYSSLVADRIKSEHRIVYQTPEENFNLMKNDLFSIIEEPVAGPCGPYIILDSAIRKHVKVALNGSGGDEIFGGYVRYYIALFEKAIQNKLSGNEFNFSIHQLEDNLTQIRGYESLFLNYRNTYNDINKELYYYLVFRGNALSPYLSKDITERLNNYDPYGKFIKIFNKNNTTYLNKILYYEQKTSLPGLIQLDDRGSMSVGLEIRSPLLDYRLVELLATVPDNIKMKNGELKYLFKQVVKDVLPKELIDRKDKSGTLYPINIHFKNEYKDFIYNRIFNGSFMESGILNKDSLMQFKKAEKSIPDRALWGLISLSLWYDRFMTESETVPY